MVAVVVESCGGGKRAHDAGHSLGSELLQA